MPKHKKHHKWIFLGVLIISVIIFVVNSAALRYSQPLPSLSPASFPLKLQPTTPVALAWPGSGEAAVGALGYGVLATTTPQITKPIASVAKVITALSVLKEHPLTVGQQGPLITFDDSDVAIYNQYVAQGGSVTPIQSGEQMSEYQALQAILLPSANNIADSLARWAFGSIASYTTYAKALTTYYGLDHTVVGDDASGFLPSTVSTPSDLVQLGEIAIQNPVITQIVSQKQAILPITGSVQNVNWLLGQNGINGIKTGNTDQAGGVYLFTAPYVINNQSVTIVGAIQGSPSLQAAIESAVPLLNSAKANFTANTVVHAGQVVANYNVPWSQTIPAVARRDILMVTWKGTSIQSALTVRAIPAPTPAHTEVGSLLFTSGPVHASTPVDTQQTLDKPSWMWRITRK